MPQAEDMRNLSPTGIYRYGVSLHELDSRLDESKPRASEIADLLAEIANMKDIRGFSNIGVNAEDWREFVVENKNLTGILLNTVLTESETSSLQEDVRNWKAEFENEITDLYTFTPITDIPAEKLLRGPDQFLNVELGEDYEDEFYDLTEACYGVAMGINTASEFMCLRAVESLVRNWYANEIGDEDVPNWNGALEALSKSSEEEDLTKIRLLDILRERRNKLAHPDVHSTARDAETTLKQTFTVVEGIIETLESE